jgi:hypothetical protein
MSFKAFQRTILAAALVGGTCAGALAQIPIPVPPLPGLDVRITTGRPPALRHERRSARPGSDYIWVGGFWHPDGGRWGWVPGRWDRPAVANAYWIPARYIRTSRGTIYEPGHWSHQQVVVTDDIRRRDEWRRHERQHDRELEQERDRDRYRDRDHR